MISTKNVCFVICLSVLNFQFASSALLIPKNVLRTAEPQLNVTNNSSNEIEQSSSYIDLPPQCPSQVYCYGNLLHTVQMASIYSDSKTFVDMKMHVSEAETLAKFEAFMSGHNQTPTKAQIKEWVESNFAARGNEFVDWIPDDWVREPTFLERIKDNALREWASDLNSFWIKLGRKMKQDVQDNESLYSIIHVPNPVMVPGGRFLEFYYWDSYWIVRGLLHCQMFTVSRELCKKMDCV